MSIIRGHLLSNESEANRAALNVSINWQYWLSCTKQENTRRCFRTNTLKAIQPCRPLFYRQVTQKVKVQFTTLLSDLAHNSLQSWCLDLGPIHVRNSILYLIHRRITYRLPGAKTLQKIVIGSSGLLIPGAMG